MPSLKFCSAVTTLITIFVATARPKELNIAWLAPELSHNDISAPGGVDALSLVLRDINTTGLLSGFNIRVHWADSKCDSKAGLANAAVMYEDKNRRPDVYLGPACSVAMRCTAQLASYWNIAVFGMMSSDAYLMNRTTYSTLVRMLGPLNTFQKVLKNIAQVFKWNKFYMIQDDWSAYVGVAEALKDEARQNGYSMQEANKKVSGKMTLKELKSIFNESKKSLTTIFLMVVRWKDMPHYLEAAKDMGMVTKDYVYICIHDDLYVGDEVQRELQSDWILSKDSGSTLKSVDYRNVLHIAMATMTQDKWARFKKETKHVDKVCCDLPASGEVDRYAPFLYDAVMTWATLVNRTLRDGILPNNGSHIFNLARNFRSPSGKSGSILLDHNGDRTQNIWVFTLVKDGSKFDLLETFVFGNGTTNGIFQSDVLPTFSNIIWYGGKTGPDNAPRDTYKPQTVNHVVIIAVIGGVACALIVCAMLVYTFLSIGRRRRLLHSTAWKIEGNDIEYVSDTAFEEKLNPDTVVYQAYFGHVRRLESIARADHNSSIMRRRKPSGVSEMSETPEDGANMQIYAPVAYVKGAMVAVKSIPSRNFNLNKSVLRQFNQLMGLKHQNVCGFVGACVDPGNVCVMWEYCNKGSLQDVIWNDNIKLDSVFQYAICLDVAKGIDYIHKSQVGYHGNLKSSNCVIDSRWTCKLTDFGLTSLKSKTDRSSSVTSDLDTSETLLWSAPEILRNTSDFDRQKADVYSLAVVIKEVICRNSPFSEYADILPADVIHRITFKRQSSRAFRPSLHHPSIHENKDLLQLLQDCWAEDPKLRPSGHRVVKTLDRINPNRGGNMIDNMISMLEKYANNLEELVSERTRQLDEEKCKTEDLLYRMLPRTVAEDLRMGKKVEAELFDNVTVYFSDIVGFTSICANSSPLQVVAMLNSLYTLFDDIVSKYDVYKVETIGDAYMLVSGLPRRNGSHHTFHISDCALDLLKSVSTFTVPQVISSRIRIRIGIHSGPVVAGVVGLTMPRYCLFGDTVNTASRMETTGLPMKIHISPVTYEVLHNYPDYQLTCRGEIQVKGKGALTTYFLDDKHSPFVKTERLIHQNSMRHKSLQKTLSTPDPRLLGVSRQSSAKSLSNSVSDCDSSHSQSGSNGISKTSRRRTLSSEPSLPRVSSGHASLSLMEEGANSAKLQPAKATMNPVFTTSSSSTCPAITITDSPFPPVPVVTLNGITCPTVHKIINGQTVQTYL